MNSALAKRLLGVVRSGAVAECEAATSLWNRQGGCAIESSSSRWLPAAAGAGGSSGESTRSREALFAMWGAGMAAGAVAVEVGRSDYGVACAESAEPRVEPPLSSPMGKTPASKLAQPTFFLSGGFSVPSPPSVSFMWVVASSGSSALLGVQIVLHNGEVPFRMLCWNFP